MWNTDFLISILSSNWLYYKNEYKNLIVINKNMEKYDQVSQNKFFLEK